MEVKDETYYTDIYEEPGFYTHCQYDLESGLIKIYDVPFEYREFREYLLAKKALRFGAFGKDNKKEKRLFSEQVASDILECKKRKARNADLPSTHLYYRMDERIKMLKEMLYRSSAEGFFGKKRHGLNKLQRSLLGLPAE